jgi:hypothetical protein
MLSISCFDILFADHAETPQLTTHDNCTEKFFLSATGHERSE